MENMQMTSKERTLAAFRGEPVDHYPLVNPVSVANVECMRISKSFFPYAHFDYSKMASLAATGHSLLKFDSISPYFSTCNEAAALGCAVDWGSIDSIPTVKEGIFKTLDRITVPQNFLEQKYIKTILNAIKLLKHDYGDSAAIIGKIVGPLTLLFYIYGLQNTLTSLVLEPEHVRQIVLSLKDLSIQFAFAQIECGADIITISDDASGDNISSNGYRYFAMEANNAIQNALSGNTFTVYHLSGVVMDKLSYIMEGGFDALSFDSRNSIIEILKQTRGRMKLIGSIDNPKTLLNGSPDEVAEVVYQCIESGIDMIAPECAIPCRVTNENLLAIYNAVDKYSKRNIRS